MIESYSFGNMIINGKKFSSDLIIFQDIIRENWWRKKGHELCVADIKQAVEDFNPTTLVIGSGKFGMMKVLPETEEYLKAKNIKLIAQKTDDAFSTYNELYRSGKILGAFHLTC